MEVGVGSSASKKTMEVTLNLSKKGDKKGGRALVGKVMTEKKLNKPTVISMIKKGWQIDNDVEIHEMERSKNVFMFRFKNEEDMAKILKGRPWSIQGFLLNLQVYVGRIYGFEGY